MSSKRYAMVQPANMERRSVVFNTRADKETGKISGYASHFGSVDSYGTAIKKGAFATTLKRRAGKIPLLFNHHTDQPIGVPKVLREDGVGLYFEANIVESTRAGAEVMALLREGVPLGMSFGFETVRDRPATERDLLDYTVAPARFNTEKGRKQVRVIEEVILWEASVVTFSANEFATIDSIRKHRNRYAEFQKIQAGFVLDLIDKEDRKAEALMRNRLELIASLTEVAS